MGWTKRPLAVEDVEVRLSRLPSCLTAVVDAAKAIAQSGAWEDEGGALLAGHQPDQGSEAYDLVLHPGLPPSAVEAYQDLHEIPLPQALAELLSHLNGAELFRLSIYGAPLSMIEDPPLLTRSSRAPLNLGSGAHWRYEYEEADPQAVLFASCNVSYTGQVGYFMFPDGQVIGRGKGGAPARSGPWADVSAWLTAVLSEPPYRPPPLPIRRSPWMRLRAWFGRLPQA